MATRRSARIRSIVLGSSDSPEPSNCSTNSLIASGLCKDSNTEARRSSDRSLGRNCKQTRFARADFGSQPGQDCTSKHLSKGKASLSQPTLSISSFFAKKTGKGRAPKVKLLLLSSDSDDERSTVSRKKFPITRPLHPVVAPLTVRSDPHPNLLELEVFGSESDELSDAQFSEHLESDSSGSSSNELDAEPCPLCQRPIIHALYSTFESFISKMALEARERELSELESELERSEASESRRCLTKVSSKKDFFCSLHAEALYGQRWAARRQRHRLYVPPSVSLLAATIPERLDQLNVREYSRNVLLGLISCKTLERVSAISRNLSDSDKRNSYVCFSKLTVLPNSGYYGTLGRLAIEKYFRTSPTVEGVKVDTGNPPLEISDLYRFAIVPDILINLVAMDNGFKSSLKSANDPHWYERSVELIASSPCVVDKTYLSFLFYNTFLNS